MARPQTQWCQHCLGTHTHAAREVVERVVWEVVPQLAEAIIKEEILRITKDG